MSELRVTELHTPTAGRRADGGIQIDANDNVTIDGLNLPNAGSYSDRNLIINGAMVVNQRGFSSADSGYGCIDRFQGNWDQGAVLQSKQALPDDADNSDPFEEGFRFFFRIANTTGNTSASCIRRIMTILEAQDVANSGWDCTNPNADLTLSFWVRSSVAQRYACCIYTTDGTAQTYSFPIQDNGGTTLSANTWTKITHVIPGNANLVFDQNSDSGLQIDFVPFFGTDFTGTKAFDQWDPFVNNDRTADMVSTWAGTNGATFDITGVQLEVGSVATPFEHRKFGEELALCQRYYCKTFAQGTTPVSNGGQTGAVGFLTNGSSATLFDAFWAFPVTLRANPTDIATFSPNAAGTNWSTNGNSTPTASVANTGWTGVQIRGNPVNAGYVYFINITADAELGL